MTLLATPQEMKPVIDRWVERGDYYMLTIDTDWHDRRFTSTEAMLAHFSNPQHKAKCGKKFRPWTFVDPSTLLDPQQPWVGFEVESGYNYQDDHDAAMLLLEKSAYRVCVDTEGSGDYPTEITFMPVNFSELRTCAGPEEIIRMAAKIRPAEHDSYDEIGTHLNLSTPKMRNCREATRDYYFHMTDVVGAVLEEAFTDEEKDRLLGRSNVYGYEPEVHLNRIEFKWFNTTYDSDTWSSYCDTVEAVVKFVLSEEKLFGPGYIHTDVAGRFSKAMRAVLEAA